MDLLHALVPYPQPTVLLIREWCHPVLLFKLSPTCRWQLLFPNVKPISAVQAHIGSRGTHVAVHYVSPSGDPRSFRKKLIVFPLNQFLLLLRHVRAPLPPVTQARNTEVVLDSIFILVPHFQTIFLASISQIGTFLLFWLPTALILTLLPLTWTSYVVSSLLAYPLQACYPSNFPKHQNDPIIPWIKAPPRPFVS